MMIEAEFDLQVYQAQDGEEAINLLKMHPDIAVIISDYDMPKMNGADVYQYVQKTLNKPFILIYQATLVDDDKLIDFFDKDSNYNISKPFEHEKFVKILSLALAQSQRMQNQIEPIHSENTNYLRIRGTRLLEQDKYIANTFIKIPNGGFIQIGIADTAIDHAKVITYLEKGVEYLYQDKEQFNQYINSTIKKLSDRITQSVPTSENITTLHTKSIKEVRELVKIIGVKEPVVQLTEQVASVVTSTIKNEKNLSFFLQGLVLKESYFFEHSNIINYLCAAMVKELGWDTERATKRFITASMFFDMALSKPTLATFHTIKSENFTSLPKNSRTEILEHINTALKILAKSKSIIGDEFKIIEHHHEKPDGSGFPKGLNADQIPPQSAVFIIAHDFAHQLIINGGPEKISNAQIFDKLGPEYANGNFERPYLALKKALSHSDAQPIKV
jgi:response regulator RpfG family c-di-GMP phosphodiesterase